MAQPPTPSAAELHKQWAKLEDEQHQLAITIHRAKTGGVGSEPARQRQAELLLEINSLVAAMPNASATTIEDFIALVDVALEHELDLASDIAWYGPSDYPIIARLLRALACKAPGFEFNSLRRWLSAPGQFEELMGTAAPLSRLEGCANDSRWPARSDLAKAECTMRGALEFPSVTGAVRISDTLPGIIRVGVPRPKG